MKIKQGAFTLIELMITIAVVAIIAAMAAPSFAEQIRRNQLNTAVSEIILAASEARSEAVLRRRSKTLNLSNTEGADKSWLPSKDVTWDTVPRVMEYNFFGYLLGGNQCYVLTHVKDTSLKAVIRFNTNGAVIFNRNETACG